MYEVQKQSRPEHDHKPMIEHEHVPETWYEHKTITELELATKIWHYATNSSPHKPQYWAKGKPRNEHVKRTDWDTKKIKL